MLKDLKAKVVGANVKTTDPELDAVLDSYAIVKAAGGAQIGVVGATTPSTPSISSPGQNVKFEDVATNVQTAIDELKGKGVKW